MYGLHRRGLLGLGAGLVFCGGALAQTAGPIAETRTGRVQGLALGSGVKAFKGIPYGADTGGANRFMPPRPPAPWADVRPATAFGPTPPQPPRDDSEYGRLMGWDAPAPAMGEDCLTLNVWTRGVADGARRPVIVSFPGDGWSEGSAADPAADGAALVAFADVVCVTANHRLGAFGYLDLSAQAAPAGFEHSGVAGAMDMVAALAWVRDNIAAFGGDPARVTILGGDKVAVLCAMPSAKGLFHRAVIQDAAGPLRALDAFDARDPAEQTLRALGIRDVLNEAGKLRTVGWRELVAAASTRGGKTVGLMARASPPPVTFAPVLHAEVLPHHPFEPAAPPESAGVPMIVGHCLETASRRFTNFDAPDASFRAFANTVVGESNSARAIALYEAETVATPFLRQARLDTDRWQGQAADAVAERKAKVGKVYRYVWALPLDPRFGAVQGADLKATYHAGGGASGEALASAVVAFAQTGEPGAGWPAFDATRRATMVFGETARVENDPRGEFRRLWLELKTP